jgi:hypothetical protein
MAEVRYLTVKQLAVLYGVENRRNIACWQRLLSDWRKRSLLTVLRGDWKQIKEGRCYVRAYSEIEVLRLVWQRTELFAEAVKDQHCDKIQRLLLSARAAQNAQP